MACESVSELGGAGPDAVVPSVGWQHAQQFGGSGDWGLYLDNVLCSFHHPL